MWKYKEDKNIIPRSVGIGVAYVLGAGAMVAAAPLVLTAAGFTAGGAAAGSMAASMMSSAAIANSGSVAAGSLVALLQSAGAAGIGTATSVTLGATGAAIGGGLRSVLTKDKNTETKTFGGFTGVGAAAGSLAGYMKSSTAVIASWCRW